jgi:hypothetical protein
VTKPTLEFLANEAGEKEGLGDAGIETFRDAPYSSCAREAGQNSRDAEASLPIKLTFNVIRVSHDEFPSHEQLTVALEACAAGAEQEKEIEFFAHALRVARQKTIPVLEIADYNTKGLTGPPDVAGTPFHSLLKGSGVSAKESDTSGGSFGIGKNASFAVSDLQMVLYSTLYADPDSGENVFAAQGKVKLVSHVDEDGKARRATGYWGDPSGFQAIVDSALIPSWMNRAQQGTSIFSMGFRESDDWAERMTSSLVSNFFTALHREEMVFEVAGTQFQVNRNTVGSLLAREDIVAAADKSGDLADLEFAGQLYRCLVSEAAEETVLTINGLGKMRVRILAEEDMPRRVGFVRNGMLITDNLRHFGHVLARFPSSRDFIALVEPEGDEAGKLLKRLENPAHDGFSAERISSPEKRAAAETAMRQLGKSLRDLIKQKTGTVQEGAVILDELSRFFASTGPTEGTPNPLAEKNPEKQTYEVPRRKPREQHAPSATGGNRGGGGGSDSNSSGEGGGGEGPSKGSGSGGSGSGGLIKAVKLRDLRNTIPVQESGTATSRVIHFSPDATGRIQLTLQATGLNSPEVLSLKSADKGSIKNDAIDLDVVAGARYSLTVSLKDPYDGPIEVAAVSTAESGN